MAEHKRRSGPPLLEWFVGGAGACIFLTMLLVLIAGGLNGAGAPPSIEVEVERVSTVEGGYVLEFSARNNSDITAADLAIVAELQTGEQMQERTARFDYLPPHSERRGGFFFETDPRHGALALRAEGYNQP